MIAKLLLIALLSLLVRSEALDEKPRSFNRTLSEENYVIVESSAKENSIWFSFFQMFGFSSVRVNSTVKASSDSVKKADFRLTSIRIIEFNETIPIESSKNVYNFEGKQQFWTGITVENIKEKIDKKDTNIVRMNATLNEGTFQYVMNVYLTDRSCFYGNYNLDPDSAYIVQTIKNFPYKYQNSTIAVEQVVASRNSGSITSYLSFLNSAFLGSLVISPEAYDTKAGKLSVSTSDFTSIQFNVTTSNMVRESDFERVYIALGSDQQPSDVTFEEKFSVNLGSVKNDGTLVIPTGSSNNNGDDNESGATSIFSISNVLIGMLCALLIFM